MMKIKTRAAAALSVALLLLAALPVTAYAQSDEPAEDTTPPAQSETTTAKPFTPEGTGTVVDNATDEDGKEFYTITTPSEHVFYLVVDKQRDSENVYFLDAVTEKDLLALAESDGADAAGSTPSTPEAQTCTCKVKCEPGAVDTACPMCKNDLTGCTAKAAEPSGEPAPEEPAKTEPKSNTGVIVILLLVVLGAGAVGYYVKIVKPKKELDAADDFDDIEFMDGPASDDDLPEPEGYDELEGGPDGEEDGK